MFERFTERARKVMSWARQESEGDQHPYISEKHFLLGLIIEPGVSASLLKEIGLNEIQIREGLNLQPEPEISTPVEAGLFRGMLRRLRITSASHTTHRSHGSKPFTIGAKAALEAALFEANQLGDNHIGTEHLLLGLFHNHAGLAVQTLCQLTKLQPHELYKIIGQKREEFLSGSHSTTHKDTEPRPKMLPQDSNDPKRLLPALLKSCGDLLHIASFETIEDHAVQREAAKKALALVHDMTLAVQGKKVDLTNLQQLIQEANEFVDSAKKKAPGI